MSDSSDQEIPLGFTEADYYRFYLENYCILATSVLLFYDVLLTIPTELQRIWSRKFSGATLVYLLTRYALFCDRVVLTASLFLRITSDTDCAPIVRIEYVLYDLSFAAFGGFVVLRLLGILESWTPSFTVGLFWLAWLGITAVPQATSTPFAFGRPILGCGRFINTDDKTDFAFVTTTNCISLVSILLLLGLTWSKSVSTWRKSEHPLKLEHSFMSLLLRNGTHYFAIIFILQILSMIAQQTYQLYLLWDVWLEFSQVVTAIACYRFILNLCDTNTPQDAPLCLRRWSHPRIVGNMGSPLEILDPFGDPGRRVEKEEEEYIPLQDIVGNVRF